MPRPIYLATYLSTSELKSRYKNSHNPVESRRWHLLWKIALGWNLKNSALAVGISYSYAKKILKKYNEQGEVAISCVKKSHAPHQRGKKSLLDNSQLEKLMVAIKSCPSDGGVWTGGKVARWIESETGVKKVWNQRGWDYLKKCKYSWQRPRPKHRKGDPGQQQEFKLNLPKYVDKLQKQYPQAQIEVYFFDEHRVGLKPIIRKVWAPIGERPIAVVEHRYEWLYVYGFVNPKTGETSWYLIPRVNINWLNVVLDNFAQEVGAGEEKVILLVMDRAGWHCSDKVKLPPGIIVEFLPPYSPELQPAERLWNLVDEPIVNQSPETLDELEETLSSRCCILSEMKEEIRNLTNYHWLKFA